MCSMIFKGIPVSNGIAEGQLHIIEQHAPYIDRGIIDVAQVEVEATRLELAIEDTVLELHSLKDNLGKNLETQEMLIFEAHEAILRDKYFIDEIKSIIRSRRCFAENAVDICIQAYTKQIESSGNEYAKQRVYDLNDIGSKVIKNIVGESRAVLDEIKDRQIVCVKELTPSFAAMLNTKNIVGLVAQEGGGYLSHAAIILRGLEIPTLNNICFEEMRKFAKHSAIIDCYNGTLTIDPGQDEIENYDEILKENTERHNELSTVKDKPAVTVDGYKIGISANISSLEECDIAVRKNVDGIGLVRTETLFLNSVKMPGEKEQFLVYSKIAKDMKYKPVIIRTADIGGDKIPGFMNDSADETQKLRGLSYSLAHKDQFMTQIRSIIRAAEFGNVSITFPMVNNGSEIREVKKLISKVLSEMEVQGEKVKSCVKIGAVIETIEGVDNLDDILTEVDYISIGTNDLLQQTMELDRKSSKSGIREYFHPVFLKTLQYCINKANRKNKTVSICGEMASDPMASVILLGMGASDLSMCPSRALKVKSVIRKTSMKEAKEMVGNALRSMNKDYVKDIVSEWMKNA